MKVFDFDKTLYSGDSTLDFFLFCVARQPLVLQSLPKQLGGAIAYLLGRINKTQWKERFYSFLCHLDDPELMVSSFWDERLAKMNAKVLCCAHKGDIVVSASPEFLLQIPCAEYGLECVASKVNIETGATTGENCYGPEKVRRFKEQFPHAIVDEFYTDSESDKPMASIAKQSFLVKHGVPHAWTKR